ncbi:MAG: hypothetical protein ABI156_01935 [Caldimonas sp.]
MKPAVAAVALVAFFAAALVPQGAAAQTIYRCGNEYTRIPCADGRALDADDPRSAAQRNEARAIAAQERHQGREMEHERRHVEAAIKPALAVGLGPAAPASAASAPKKTTRKKSHRKAQVADDRDFVAAVPRSPKKAVANP